MDEFSKAIRYGCDQVILDVNSCGGNLWASLDFADLIMRSGKRSLAVLENEVNSSAILVAMACHERIMAPTAHIIIHDLTTKAVGGNPNTTDPNVLRKNLELRERLGTFITVRSKIPRIEVEKILDGSGKIFDAEDALQAGLVTQIAKAC